MAFCMAFHCLTATSLIIIGQYILPSYCTQSGQYPPKKAIKQKRKNSEDSEPAAQSLMVLLTFMLLLVFV